MSGVAWNVGVPSARPRRPKGPEPWQGADSVGQITFWDL